MGRGVQRHEERKGEEAMSSTLAQLVAERERLIQALPTLERYLRRGYIERIRELDAMIRREQR